MLFFLFQICRDKDEAEVLFVGLKEMISCGQHIKWKTNSKSDGALSSETNCPITYTRRNSPLSSPFGSLDSIPKVQLNDHLGL